MKLTIAGLLAEAGAYWRRDRDVISPVAGLLAFLPAFALLMLLPDPERPPAGATPDAAQAALLGYLADNFHWLALRTVTGWLGTAALLALYLDRDRPTVGVALARALVRLPRYALAMLVAGVATFAGLFLFVLPGCYIIGRTFLVGPAVLSQNRPLFAAAGDAVERTAGQGWRLFLLVALLFLAGQGGQIIATGLGALLVPASLGEPWSRLPMALVGALSISAVLVINALAQVAAYRRIIASNGM